MRLEADVRDDVRRVGRFDDMRCSLQSRFDVAGLFGLTGARISRREHFRRVGCHRLLHVGKMWQRFVLHLDEPGRVERAFLGVGGDGRDGIALIHHLRASLAVLEHCLDARGFLSRGQIDRHDPCVRMRRPDDLSVDHPGATDVVGVLRATSDFFRCVDALNMCAQQLGFGRPCQLRIRPRRTPIVVFAFCAASITRTNVPHRQMLPSRPLRICSGVALGYFSSSATVATTNPGVQKPHIRASTSQNACCTGCIAPLGAARPSTVRMVLPCTSIAKRRA